MTKRSTVHANPAELEAAARLLKSREPAADFDALVEDDPEQIMGLVKEIRKAEKASEGTFDVAEPKSIVHETDLEGHE